MANYQKQLLKMLVSTVSEMTQSGPSGSPTGESAKKAEQRRQREADASRRSEGKRRLAGGVAIAFLLAAGIGYWTEVFKDWTDSASTSEFLVSALTRIGMVFGALWLAWDSLRRPARWLPPGLAVLGVVSIAVIAAQPKLILAILPLVGTLVLVTSLVRVFRRE